MKRTFSPLKMDGWKMILLLPFGASRAGLVSGPKISFQEGFFCGDLELLELP